MKDSTSPDDRLLRLTLPAGSEQTELILGRGALDQAAALLDAYRGVRLLIVSDEHVAPLYAAPLCERLTAAGYRAHLLTIAAGEQAKSLATLSELYAACQALHVERADLVVALGGGVVGDVAGMLAGTYLRGLRLVQAPTTLVAQVTASVGGKVGVNFGGEKNVIGMFKQPQQILIDPDALATLPPVELRSGLGELITVGVLGAPELFESLAADGPQQLDAQIAAAIRCKSALVAADPFDQRGIRAKLNLGHTFGHALEQLSDFSMPHGLAVAVGLHLASRLAAALGLCPAALVERIERTLRALDLPTAVRGYRPEQVIAAMRGDKKRSGGRLRWVLPIALGEVVLVGEDQVPPALLHDVIEPYVWQGGA